MFFQHNILLWYKKLKPYITFLKLILTSLNLRKINNKIRNNFVAKCTSQVLSSLSFVVSSIRLISKGDCGFQKTHNFFFSLGFFVNDSILKKLLQFYYQTFDNELHKIVEIGRHFVIIKREIKNVFCNMFLALKLSWVLGLFWNTYFYTQNCLLFRFSKFLFIFHDFAGVSYWDFWFFISWDWEYYLNNLGTLLSAI